MVTYDAVLVNTQDAFNLLLKKIENNEVIALDTETTGLNSLKNKIVGISVCFNQQEAYYIPVFHKNYKHLLDLRFVLKGLEKATKGRLIVMHNVKFDFKFFKESGWEIKNSLFCTMIADYLLNPNKKHKLDDCSYRELNIKKISTEELIGKGDDQITFDAVPVAKTTQYACEDAYCCFMLYEKYRDELKKKKELNHLFYNIEMKVCLILAEMELTGVYVDPSLVFVEKQKLIKDINRIKSKIQRKTKFKKELNLRSAKQLRHFLYNVLDLDVLELTSSGKPAVSKLVLKSLSESHPVIKDIIEYRKLSGLLRFLNNLSNNKFFAKDNRVHANFNQTVARTGRLSASSPNLQGLPKPKKDDASKKLVDCIETNIRRAFIPQKKGWKIIAADYSQVELRILAALANEENMLKAFNNRIDIHEQTAAMILNKEVDDVSDSERSSAKGINFGISYGMGSRTLADRIKVSQREASQFIEVFYKSFPNILEFQRNRIAEGKRFGYIKTLFGRERPLPHINHRSNSLRSKDERLAKNSPIQGSAADIMKVAMIKVFNEIHSKKEEIKMILQIHDELVFEVREDVAEKHKHRIVELMEEAFPLELSKKVKLIVEAKIKNNWAEAH